MFIFVDLAKKEKKGGEEERKRKGKGREKIKREGKAFMTLVLLKAAAKKCSQIFNSQTKARQMLLALL